MIVLITGASAGFGAEMARKFVGHGHKVIAAGRRKERLDTLAAEPGASLPPHVNTNAIGMMPTTNQGFSPFTVKRKQ
jgi:short-subunit dehydrogenase